MFSEAARASQSPEAAAFLRSCPPSNPDYWRRCTECNYPLRWDLTSCTGTGRHPVNDPRPILYASRTGTRRNLREMAKHRYRIVATPFQKYPEPLPPWAFGLDNGAWTAHANGEPFDVDAYRATVALLGCMADWIVAPDIVCGGLESLEMSLRWLPELHAGTRRGPVLVPVQDGMTVEDVRAAVPMGPDVGLFVGGSTEWKEQTMATWTALAHEHGAWCHVGRVNTQRRLAMVVEAGADSSDGTSPTMFSVKAAPLARAAAQGPLFGAA